MPNASIIVYGANWCGDCRRAKRFLGEQMVDYRWVDIEKDKEARALVERMNNGKRIIPTIVFEDGSFLVEPSNAQLAQKLGLRTQAKCEFYDLVVIGGGPTGLTAAIYAAREGIKTLVIEKSGLGGQASWTGTIENFPGFPEGVSGPELAERITSQAHRFGVEILQAQEVDRIQVTDNYRTVHLGGGAAYNARAVLIATGAKYRRLDVPGEEKFTGAGVHFCATCDGPFYKDVEQLVVVGGGNSAAEEAIFLSKFAKKVTILVRGDRLTASHVAQDKLAGNPSIEIQYDTSVTELKGTGRLEAVVTRNSRTGATAELHPAAIFVFIGLTPNSMLAREGVLLDREGYILTGHELVHSVEQEIQKEGTKHVRLPHAMETSVRGIFAAGDVRAGSTKQVASAVGEGASAAIAIREYLRGE